MNTEIKQPLGFDLEELVSEISPDSYNESYPIPNLDIFIVPDPQRPEKQLVVKRIIFDLKDKKLLLLPD